MQIYSFIGKTLGIWIVLSILFACGSTPLTFGQTVTSYSFDQPVYYQGDTGTLSVTLTNSNPYQISTKQFFLQFDWQETQNFVFNADSTGPNLANGISYTFIIHFSIPSDVAIGPHTFKVVWVDAGILLGTQVVIQPKPIVIHDAFEKVYIQTLNPLTSKVSSIQGTTFQSPDANALIRQALDKYKLATSLATQGQFRDAVDALNAVSSFIDQARAAETTFIQQQTILIGVGVGVAAAIAILVLFFRRKKRVS